MKHALGLLLLAGVVFGADASPKRHVRATGTVRAVRSVMVQVPRISGQGNGRLTLARLAPNGLLVKPGDLLAEFDATNDLKLLREAQAKFDDLKHQVDQKAAEHQNNAAKRASDLKQAEADLRKAELEIRKGPILSEIEQQKNQVKLEDAQSHVASLKRSNAAHDAAEKAELRILELQRDRQNVSVERQKSNLEKLSLHAPIGGMVSLSNTFRNQSFSHAQEGDQLYSGSPLIDLFDPSEMEVELNVGEPDGSVLVPGAKATVYLDAFPGLKFTAHFESASPVATSGMDSAVKTFQARFRLENHDARLMPDLSVALDIEAPE